MKKLLFLFLLITPSLIFAQSNIVSKKHLYTDTLVFLKGSNHEVWDIQMVGDTLKINGGYGVFGGSGSWVTWTDNGNNKQTSDRDTTVSKYFKANKILGTGAGGPLEINPLQGSGLWLCYGNTIRSDLSYFGVGGTAKVKFFPSGKVFINTESDTSANLVVNGTTKIDDTIHGLGKVSFPNVGKSPAYDSIYVKDNMTGLVKTAGKPAGYMAQDSTKSPWMYSPSGDIIQRVLGKNVGIKNAYPQSALDVGDPITTWYGMSSYKILFPMEVNDSLNFFPGSWGSGTITALQGDSTYCTRFKFSSYGHHSRELENVTHQIAC